MPVRARLNLVLTAFDLKPVRKTISEMNWRVVDLSDAPCSLLLSDRPVEFWRINTPEGSLWMPISPTKLFVAANDATYIEKLLEQPAKEVVTKVNIRVTERARRFVWARDRTHNRLLSATCLRRWSRRRSCGVSVSSTAPFRVLS